MKALVLSSTVLDAAFDIKYVEPNNSNSQTDKMGHRIKCFLKTEEKQKENEVSGPSFDQQSIF